MADDTKQFKVDIVGEDHSSNAFAAVEASYRQLGLTAEQVDAEMKRLESVNEEDSLAQHFRSAEVELRRLGLTSETVAGEMARLHAMSPAPPEDEFARAEAAFAQLGLSAKQMHAQMASLEEISKHDVVAQHFEAAEQQIRSLGLTSKASTEMVEGLRKAVAKAEESHLSGYDRWMGRLHRFGRRSEGGEGGEGGEHEEHPGHGWDGISAHFNILRDHFGELKENVGETRESLAEMFPMLAGFGAIGSAAGLVELIHSTAEAQAQLEAMSKQLGLSANQLEALHYAANMSDVGIETMDKSMGKLGVTIQETVSGHDKAASAIFSKMGIRLKDAHGHLVPMTTILPEVAQALKNTADPQMRLFVATELFGKAGRDMLPLLIQGAAHIKDLTEEADKLGPALTDLDRDHLEQFNDAWKKAQYAAESFMTKVGADLSPVLTPLLDDFSTWVSANKEWLSADIAADARELVTWLKGFDWKDAANSAIAMGKGIGVAFTDINDLVTKIPHGWEWIGGALAVYKTAAPFAHMISDGMRLIGLGVDLIVLVGGKLPAALAIANTAWGTFATAGIVAFDGIKAAALAANDAFVTTPLGRALAAALTVADLASELGNKPTQMTPAQMKLYQSFHLKPNEMPTANEVAQLNALGPSVGNASAQGVAKQVSDISDGIVAFAKRQLFGPDADATDPASPYVPLPGRPRGPMGRFAPTAAPGDADGGSNGTVRVHVSFDNAPPNLTVTTTSSGNTTSSVDVGYNQLGAYRPGMPW